MTKIMLVEDDNNLREIYQARLAAEGYEIVSSSDGEAALALAAKEKPDMIISDVMMPKISGFEMLDILRNTDGLKNVKVIMLTALGQAEDSQRANSLGADRYLVKSQVTLEDIVKAAHDLLDGQSDAAPAGIMPQAPMPAATEAPAVAVSASVEPPAVIDVSEPAPVEPATPDSLSQPAPYAAPDDTSAQAGPEPAEELRPAPEAAAAPAPEIPVAEPPAPKPATAIPVVEAPAEEMPTEQLAQSPATSETATDTASANTAAAASTPTSTDVPADDTSAQSDDDAAAESQSAATEEASIKQQIDNFISQQPATAPEQEPQAEPEPETLAAFAPPVISADDDNMAAPSVEPADTAEPSAAIPAPSAPDMTSVTTPEDTLLAGAADGLSAAASAEQPTEKSVDDEDTKKKVIAPLGSAEKPDLDQLLAVEDAKTAAGQAAAQPIAQSPAVASPQPNIDAYSAPPQTAQPSSTSADVDPNSISL